MQTGDAAHGVVNPVAFESAVTKALPALQPGKGMLDAGPDPFV